MTLLEELEAVLHNLSLHRIEHSQAALNFLTTRSDELKKELEYARECHKMDAEIGECMTTLLKRRKERFAATLTPGQDADVPRSFRKGPASGSPTPTNARPNAR